MAVVWVLTALIFASVDTLLVDSAIPAKVARTKRQEECGGLANSISEECLQYYQLISADNSTMGSNATQAFISEVCEGDCGRKIYDYFVKCDVSSAAFLDLVCAINNVSDTRCIAFSSLTFNTLSTVSSVCSSLGDPDAECNAKCNSTITAQINAMGCCFYTYYGLILGTNYTDYLFSSCSADITVCDGGFSNETITLPDVPPTSGNNEYDNYCPDVSTNGIPESCRNFIQFDNILQFASTEPDQFVASFCKGECAKPVYDYYKDCDEVSKNSTAPNLDLMCTSNPEGKECVKIISDVSVQRTLFGCASVLTSDQCPKGCSAALQKISDDYGCCFYTQFALFETVDVDGILHDKCGVETPGLCRKGGISGNVIDAPGGKTYDDKTGDDETDDASAVKPSLIMVFTTLLYITTYLETDF